MSVRIEAADSNGERTTPTNSDNVGCWKWTLLYPGFHLETTTPMNLVPGLTWNFLGDDTTSS